MYPCPPVAPLDPTSDLPKSWSPLPPQSLLARSLVNLEMNFGRIKNIQAALTINELTQAALTTELTAVSQIACDSR